MWSDNFSRKGSGRKSVAVGATGQLFSPLLRLQKKFLLSERENKQLLWRFITRYNLRRSDYLSSSCGYDWLLWRLRWCRGAYDRSYCCTGKQAMIMIVEEGEQY